MDCGHFIEIIADFQEGKLAAVEQSAAEDHLRKCADCRAFLDVVRGNRNMLPENQRDELARSILDRTSGPVCPRVESSLWEFAGGETSAQDSKMIALHLDHCADCKSLAEAFAAMQEVLPAMAEIDPGSSFTTEVVSLTSGLHPYRSSLRTRFLTWWNGVIHRPRFSLEAAYIGTMLVFLLFSSPFLPFRNIQPEQVRSAAMRISTSHLLSIKASAKVPALATWSSMQAIPKLISSAAFSCRTYSISVADASVQGIKKWSQKEAAALSGVWHHLVR
jgi:hypothetical protein